jgi:hypothetical protein
MCICRLGGRLWLPGGCVCVSHYLHMYLGNVCASVGQYVPTTCLPLGFSRALGGAFGQRHSLGYRNRNTIISLPSRRRHGRYLFCVVSRAATARSKHAAWHTHGFLSPPPTHTLSHTHIHTRPPLGARVVAERARHETSHSRQAPDLGQSDGSRNQRGPDARIQLVNPICFLSHALFIIPKVCVATPVANYL